MNIAPKSGKKELQLSYLSVCATLIVYRVEKDALKNLLTIFGKENNSAWVKQLFKCARKILILDGDKKVAAVNPKEYRKLKKNDVVSDALRWAIWSRANHERLWMVNLCDFLADSRGISKKERGLLLERCETIERFLRSVLKCGD